VHKVANKRIKRIKNRTLKDERSPRILFFRDCCWRGNGRLRHRSECVNPRLPFTKATACAALLFLLWNQFASAVSFPAFGWRSPHPRWRARRCWSGWRPRSCDVSDLTPASSITEVAARNARVGFAVVGGFLPPRAMGLGDADAARSASGMRGRLNGLELLVRRDAVGADAEHDRVLLPRSAGRRRGSPGTTILQPGNIIWGRNAADACREIR